MKVRFGKPCEVLRPYIDRYWGWDATDNSQLYLPVVPPGVGLDLFIHYQKPFGISGRGQMAKSHLIFSLEKASIILPSDNIGFIAVRFKAGMFKNFTDVPLAGLVDLYPDMEGLWGSGGRALSGRLNSVGSFIERAVLLDDFLTGLLGKFKKDSVLWNVIVHDLYYHQDVLRLEALAQRQRISYRHFRRRFIAETGMAPKHFQQLARFHSVLKPLLLNKEKHYLSAALDKGYFDQMHFIKEFRCFLQCTPTEFLQENNFMSHFYYPALSARYNFAGK